MYPDIAMCCVHVNRGPSLITCISDLYAGFDGVQTRPCKRSILAVAKSASRQLAACPSTIGNSYVHHGSLRD